MGLITMSFQLHAGMGELIRQFKDSPAINLYKLSLIKRRVRKETWWLNGSIVTVATDAENPYAAFALLLASKESFDLQVKEHFRIATGGSSLASSSAVVATPSPPGEVIFEWEQPC